MRAGLIFGACLAAGSVLTTVVALAPQGRQTATSRHAIDRVVGVAPLVQLRPEGSVPGYDPAQIRTNYDMAPVYAAGIDGTGETIGIVDVYGSPTIRADLKRFDSDFHIPAPPSFTIVRPAGPVPKFEPSNGQMAGWALETSLDVEWAHAMAPGAKIVLAETGVDEVEGTSGFPEIVKAEKYLISHEHVSVISQSFAATEETFPSRSSVLGLRSDYVDAEHHHVTVLAGSGDWGASGYRLDGTTLYERPVTNWPASDPLVTAVGGTQLSLKADGQQSSAPMAWSDSGGGRSSVFSRPSWQHDVEALAGSKRALPDISMDASGASAVVVVMSFEGTTEFQAVYGTSLATPLFAGIVALADQLAGKHLGFVDPLLYKLGNEKAAGLVDVTKGNNYQYYVTKAKQHRFGYKARRGYDLVTGWGTVSGAQFVPTLAGKPLPPP